MTRYTSKLLTLADLSSAGALAAAAFAESPPYIEIMPGDATERVAFLQWMFEKNFNFRLDEDCCRCTYDGDLLISFFMFVKPHVRPISMWDMLTSGLVCGFWSYGYSTVHRLLATMNWFEAKEKEIPLHHNIDTTKLIKLERMTVLPSHQGKGVGSFSLGAALKEADELGFYCMLTTQERQNVTFYSRLGFNVVDESKCPVGEGYLNWVMIREPTMVVDSE